MRPRHLILLASLSLAATPALADGFLRDILSSGATTASTYMTFKDHKLLVPLKEDASSFVASAGQIRGPYLEAALQQVRSAHPELQASDLALAEALLASAP